MTAAQIAYAAGLNPANKIKFLMHTIQLLEQAMKQDHNNWRIERKNWSGECKRLRREISLLKNSP